jgi:DNA-binding NarL/FixJ family response regulator
LAPTRIAFIDMPRMLREILDDALTSRDDVRLVDEARNGCGLVEAVDRSGAALLIVSSESVGPVEVCKLLSDRPHVKVFAVADGGLDGCLYEMRPNLVAVDELSARGLVQTILGVDREADRRERARNRKAIGR